MLTQSDLDQYIGTENWYQYAFNKDVTYTDGVKYFIDEAQAHWLLDTIALDIVPNLVGEHPFLHIILHVANHSAVLSVGDGNGVLLCEDKIEYTDCPEGKWSFYFTDKVLLLPSEY